MKTFKQFREQIAPSKGGIAVRGSDGKITKMNSPVDLRTLDRKMQNVRNQAIAKFGRP
tara:strand:+ start:1023 stop:1196 length:174 start_codon:yes stop_codon:yes gene_type:complete